MSAQATCRDTAFAGLPACELALPQGDHLRVALHGAHVLSWVSGGQERLYLSPKSTMDGQAAIRGGVPVCFPQFNQRGPMADRLPKHGFARNVAWLADAPELGAEHARLTLRLNDNAQTRAWWPQAFALALHIDLSPGAVQLTLDVHNTDTQALAFSGALHTYLAVPDVTQATLQGLGGQPEWDSLTDTHAQAADMIRFAAEFDRVYEAGPQPLTLNDTLHISQSPSWANSVVWNPAQDLCKRLADMPDEGWRHMLCIEAAQVYTPINLPAGGRWAGWQRLQVRNP
ncbi:D-hexose-6-phosphate mutarotase [Limnohabitans sp. 63ED37-2]|uniref:D-hexose-6-phosphate mutarotase n=1 Tax=Limnohabitans sp. 63ED37-2 TaxID=1678128 RepID=UPI00070605FE|nr:D-hexose-6-phosphate mutarotase [Limnohabitans sp. 63ED37-2]ALK89786.1 Putative glucose-6-phosphate 1-epimerase [Limnohabitans sp. 63ED37-2]